MRRFCFLLPCQHHDTMTSAERELPHGIRSAAPMPGEDDDGLPPFKALTRQEAQALIAQQPSISPWRVIGVQAAVGVAVAALVWLVWRDRSVALSALYGAAVVVVPGILMARGMTSRFSSMNAGTSAVSFMLWEVLKIAASVAMLMLAPRLVQELSWPALLAGLIVCIKVYWLALSWRGRS
jgi:ATP synthase protein I